MAGSIIGMQGVSVRWVVRMGETAVDIMEVLKILRALSDRKPHTISDLKDLAGMSYSTLSKYIPLMERAGLVKVLSILSHRFMRPAAVPAP